MPHFVGVHWLLLLGISQLPAKEQFHHPAFATNNFDTKGFLWISKQVKLGFCQPSTPTLVPHLIYVPFTGNSAMSLNSISRLICSRHANGTHHIAWEIVNLSGHFLRREWGMLTWHKYLDTFSFRLTWRQSLWSVQLIRLTHTPSDVTAIPLSFELAFFTSLLDSFSLHRHSLSS